MIECVHLSTASCHIAVIYLQFLHVGVWMRATQAVLHISLFCMYKSFVYCLIQDTKSVTECFFNYLYLNLFI